MSVGQKCRECSCTDLNPCDTWEGPCHWVLPDVCSACAKRVLHKRGVSMDPETEALLEHPVQMAVTIGDLFQIIAAIQLACRHSGFVGPTRDYVESWAKHIQSQISRTPLMTLLLAAGWDPTLDLPPGERKHGLILPPGYEQ